MLGIVSLSKALDLAKSANLDLVEISPNAEPPVCKILDFNRFKYELKKRQQESKKKQKKITTKEMKFKVNIGPGDFDVKLRKITKFVQEGDKVKVSLWFKGREIIHKEKGFEVFEKIIAKLDGIAKIDQEPKIEGKQIIMLLSNNNG